MNWLRSRYRGDGRPARLLTRPAMREMVKGGGGALFTAAGAGIGSLVGFLGTRVGLPQQTVAVSAMLGTVVGEAAKGAFIGTIDGLNGPATVGDIKAILAVAGRWMETDQRRLSGLVGNKRHSHRTVLLTLTGGQPDRLRQTGRYLADACGALDRAKDLAQKVIEGLNRYRSRL